MFEFLFSFFTMAFVIVGVLAIAWTVASIIIVIVAMLLLKLNDIQKDSDVNF